MSTLLLKLTSNVSLRGMTSPDGIQVFSVYDFITLACQKTDEGAYARKTYSNLIKKNSKFGNDLVTFIQLPGSGRRKTPTCTVEGLLKLLTILGGKVSQAFKLEAFDILERYLDGDTQLCTEIHENKALGKPQSYAKFTEKVLKRAETLIENEANMMPVVGYVYATQSTAFPGLIKIGRTVDVDARLISLNTSCAPVPHMVVAVAPTLDNIRDEKMAHQFFASKRVQGEFFEISEAEVKAYFTKHIISIFHVDMAERLVLMQGSEING